MIIKRPSRYFSLVDQRNVRALVVINKSLSSLDMDVFNVPLEEALENVINTFKLQGVDLRGNSSFMTLVMVEYCTLSTSFQEIVLA